MRSVAKAGDKVLWLGLALGLVSLIAALYLWHAKSVFLTQAEYVTGHVVELKTKPDGDQTMYRPIVEFLQDGQEIRIEGSTWTSPSSHSVGEAVRVVFPRGEPSRAEILSVLQFWLSPLLAGALGFVFISVCGFLLYYLTWQRKIDELLNLRGELVQATVTRLIEDDERSEGRQRVVVECQWADSRGKTFRGKSEYLWMRLGSEASVKVGDQVAVIVDPSDHRRYRVRLSDSA